jgi:hypothetical protein
VDGGGEFDLGFDPEALGEGVGVAEYPFLCKFHFSLHIQGIFAGDDPLMGDLLREAELSLQGDIFDDELCWLFCVKRV